jgi:hypothetical protein
MKSGCDSGVGGAGATRPQPPNKPMNRSGNSLIQLTVGAIWRHNQAAGSEPVSAVAARLSPIR